MKTKAVRMYGEMDLRLEEFELPEIKDDEILAKIYSDSICMSTYKLAKQGKKHKRAPQNIDTNPIITGHEFAGIIVKVGEKWKDQFKPGMRFAQQPALNYKGSMDSPGYSYEYFGGDCTYCIFPHEAMEVGALMVGKISNHHPWGNHRVRQGEEKGMFEFGGSTIVLLLEKGAAIVDEDLLINTREGAETKVRQGEQLAKSVK